MAKNDIADKLRQVRKRRLVAEFCRRCGKSRTWFYNASRDAMALHAEHLDAVLAVSGHPIVAAREERGLSQIALAEALGVSRQTVHAWETQPVRQDRLDRVFALRKTLRAGA